MNDNLILKYKYIKKCVYIKKYMVNLIKKWWYMYIIVWLILLYKEFVFCWVWGYG